MKSTYKNVLLIDDNEADQLIARKIIQLTGFAKDISVKNSKQSALEFLNDVQDAHKDLPEVIFLDINRPGIDGFSFLQDFGKLPADVRDHCKIIVLSSTSNRQNIEGVFTSAYVEKVLVKPLTIDSLLTLLD